MVKDSDPREKTDKMDQFYRETKCGRTNMMKRNLFNKILK